MSDQSPTAVDEYTRVIEVLTRHGVDFVICGGLACILHGSTRQTRDMDIAVHLENENLRRLIRAARELKLQPRIPEPIENLADDRRRKEWVEKKNAVVFTLVSNETPLQIDIFLQYPISFDELRSRANAIAFADSSVPVSSKADLIKAKESVQPPRIHDQIDIRFLRELIEHEAKPRQ